MNIENTKAQMRKGVLEFCILNILLTKHHYAFEILKILKNSKMLVVEGTIYPLLNRLKNANLLKYHWKESTTGPPRKYYSITDDGRSFLEELKISWLEISETVTKIINQNNNEKNY